MKTLVFVKVNETDLIRCLPAFSEWKKNCEILDVVVEDANMADLFRYNPHINNVHLFSRYTNTEHYNKTIVLELDNHFYSSLYSNQNFDNIFEAIYDVPCNDSNESLFFSADERLEAKEFMSAFKLPVLFDTGNPHDTINGKHLPIQFWQDIIAWNQDVTFCQIGEKSKSYDINWKKNVTDCRDRFTTRQTSLLMEWAKCSIGVDGILNRLSYHNKHKGVFMFGSTSAQMFGSEENVNYQDVKRKCSPCHHSITNKTCCQKAGMTGFTHYDISRSITQHFLNPK